MQPFTIASAKLLVLITAIILVGIYLPHLSNALLDILYRGSIVSLAYLGIAYVWKLIPDELLASVPGFKK